MANGIAQQDDDLDELSKLVLAQSMAKQQRLNPILQAQQPGVGSTLADLAVGLGSALSGGQGPEAIQRVQAARAAENFARAKALEDQDITPSLFKIAELRQKKGEAEKALEIKEKAIEQKSQFLDLKNQLADLKSSQKAAEAEKKVADKQFELTSGIRKEVAGLQVTKDMSTIDSSYKKLLKAAENPSPAGDLSIMYNYMKLLDPSTGIKEGELALAGQTGNIPTQIVNIYNRMIQGGGRLTPEQRIDFANQAANQHASNLERYKEALGVYANAAKKGNLDFSLIAPEFAPIAPAGGKPSTGAGGPSIPLQSDIDAELRKRGVL